VRGSDQKPLQGEGERDGQQKQDNDRLHKVVHRGQGGTVHATTQASGDGQFGVSGGRFPCLLRLAERRVGQTVKPLEGIVGNPPLP